jgi:hypothetical protein
LLRKIQERGEGKAKAIARPVPTRFANLHLIGKDILAQEDNLKAMVGGEVFCAFVFCVPLIYYFQLPLPVTFSLLLSSCAKQLYNGNIFIHCTIFMLHNYVFQVVHRSWSDASKGAKHADDVRDATLGECIN